VLQADLTTGQLTRDTIDPEVYRRFLGGRGLNQYHLARGSEQVTAPFDPDSLLLLGAGLLSGTKVPGATRLSIDAKNSFSGGVGSANVGGGFSSALKCAGFGTLLIRGRAKNPVYLHIENGRISIESASGLWGKTTTETTDALLKGFPEGAAHVLAIGPAGERGVRGASVIADEGKAAGKCGVGAVMGSKNLKAVVVCGKDEISVADPGRFEHLCREAWMKVARSTTSTMLSTWGTKAGMKGKNAVGAVAFRHFQDGFMPSLDEIDEEAFAPFEQKRFHCKGCPVSCRHILKVDAGPYAGTEGEVVQCNSIQDFGSKLDIRYAPAIIRAHFLCNEYGIDIDTVAESLAWAFECYEKGLLTEKDTGGLQLRWGNHGALMALIEQIAFRRGFGDILAEGVKGASKIIGQGTEALAVTMKGQDLYEDPRMPKGYALGAALSTRGGGHCSGSPLVEFSSREYDPAGYEGKADLVASVERFHAVLNSLGICFFVTTWEGPDLLNEDDLSHLVSAATGWDLETSELMEAGARVHTLERLFNAAHAGFDRKDDYPPERFFHEPIRSGPFQGEVMDRDKFDRMLDRNYEIHGWSKEGIPRAETLEKLGLARVVSASCTDIQRKRRGEENTSWRKEDCT
jgi:aldehyde:ferredoxin oxidoreductase